MKKAGDEVASFSATHQNGITWQNNLVLAKIDDA